MKQFVLYVLIFFSFSSCLRNLNVSEFFRKLEIKSPEYAKIINANVSGFETAIAKEIEETEDAQIEWITYWGESRYACGGVIEQMDGDDFVVVLGEYKFIGEEKSRTYKMYFIPDEKELLTRTFLDYSW